MEIRSISTFGVFHRSIQFEDNNKILLRKVKFAFMIPNPSRLDCSDVVLNFWPNLSLAVLIKLFLQKKKRAVDVVGGKRTDGVKS